MPSSDLEAQAAEARNHAAERSEKLDQREAELSGKIEDLEQRINDLSRQLAAASDLVSKLERHLGAAEKERDEAAAGLTPILGNVDRQITDLQRENKVLGEKLEHWNRVEKQGVAHITAAMHDIQKFATVTATSPGNW